MRKIVTKLQASTVGDNVVVALGDKPEVSVGETVEVLVGKKSLGNMKVASVYSIRLMDITAANLVGFVYALPQIFWPRFESAMGVGLPGEFPVYFVSFVPVWEELEEFVALEEDDALPVVKKFDDGDLPTAPKKKAKKRQENKSRDWDSLSLDDE